MAYKWPGLDVGQFSIRRALCSHIIYISEEQTHCAALQCTYDVMYVQCAFAVCYMLYMGCQFQCTLIRELGVYMLENNNEYSADDMRALACMS